MPLRQAAVIYLKNTIKEHWVLEPEDVNKKVPISEQDKVAFRQNIVSKIVVSGEQIK